MYDIIFFYPYIDSKIISPPLGILFLAAVLEEHNYRIKVIDDNLDHYNLDDILTEDTLFVGISSMTGPQLLSALEIAKGVRDRNPEIPIVWGGIHASLMPMQTISHKLVDIVVEGEGEQTIVELADTLINKGDLCDISGIYFKEKSGQVYYTGPRELLDFDSLPFPAWSHIEHNLETYMKNRGGRLMIQFSRGCPFRCSFCYNKTFNKQTFRIKAPDRIIEEIEYLISKYNIRKFDICDDNFITYKKVFLDFAEKIEKRKLDVDLQLSVRLNYIDQKIIEGLSKARVSMLFIGVESGSQRIIDEIKKDIKIERIKAAIEMLSRSQIVGFYSFMFNFPFETLEDLMKTKDLAEFIYDKGKMILNLNSYCPYPGTELYERVVKEFGFKEPTTLEHWSDVRWHRPTKLFDSNFSIGFVRAFLLIWMIHFSKDNFRSGLFRKWIKKWIDLRFQKNLLNFLVEIRIMVWFIEVVGPLLRKITRRGSYDLKHK
jgi:anaerobic magnesium-protoporphyrin IX monomethyl ester cyclase